MKLNNVRKAKFLSVVLSLTLAVFVFAMCSKEDKMDVTEYLPVLKKYDVQDIKCIKVLSDPSYLKPYSVFISFKTNKSEQLLNELLLKQISEVDTVQLKNKTWLDVYKLYFTLDCINASRYKSMQEEINKIDWWNRKVTKGTVYAGSYYDDDKIKQSVAFGNKSNGRISFVNVDNTVYILIDCWG